MDAPGQGRVSRGHGDRARKVPAPRPPRGSNEPLGRSPRREPARRAVIRGVVFDFGNVLYHVD